MTPSELKSNVEQANPNSRFFSRENMKFSGDTMKNYGVRDAGDCWELYRKKPAKGALQNSALFDKKTFKRVFKEND